MTCSQEPVPDSNRAAKARTQPQYVAHTPLGEPLGRPRVHIQHLCRMTSQAFSLSLCLALKTLYVKMSSQMKTCYLLDEAVPVYHHSAFHLDIQICCMCLSHLSSLFGTDWIHILEAYFSVFTLATSIISYFNKSAKVELKHFPHTWLVKSEKLIEADEGKKAHLCLRIFCGHKFSYTYMHTHTHTIITLVATRVLCCITVGAQKRLYHDIWNPTYGTWD